MRKSLTPMIRFSNVARAMLAVSAIFAVAVSAVTLTQERALGDLHNVVSIGLTYPEETSSLTAPLLEEGSGTGQETFYVLVRLGTPLASNAEPLTIPVTLGALGDTADSSDYTAPSDIVITQGSLANFLSVQTTEDTSAESAETFTLSLGKLPPGFVANPDAGSVTITIIDNDNTAAEGTLSIDVVEADQDGNPIVDQDGNPIVLGDENLDGKTDAGFIPKVGQFLVADTSAIYDADNDVNNDEVLDETESLDFEYQWIRTNDGATLSDDDDEVIDGETEQEYQLTEDDVGDTFTVQVWSSDQHDNGNRDANEDAADSDVGENNNGYTLDRPADTAVVAYNKAEPLIIVGESDPAVGADSRLSPGDVLTRNSSGMSSLRTNDVSSTGNVLINLDEMGNPVQVTVDLNGDGIDDSNVLMSAVTFTWYRGIEPIAECAADGTQTRDANGDLARAEADINPCTDSTYELVNADVAKTITLVASYQTLDASQTTDANDKDKFATIPSIVDIGRVYSSNRATGMPTISGIGQVGHTLTVAEGDIADADNGSDGFDNPMFSYQWLRGGEAIAGAVFSSYTLTDADIGEVISVLASFTDNLGDREAISSIPTLPIGSSPGKISRIEPAIGDITVSGGDEVTLSVDVYGRQDAKDNDLSGTFTWTVDGEVDGDLGSGREAKFTAPDDPGRYMVVASLEAVDCYDEDDDTACMAEFVVMVRRPSAPVADPVPPVNPPGEIPGLIPDADGNQYEVFTPVEGGTFDGGEGYSINVPSGAVPNGEYIGIRMSDDGAASNLGMTHQRYTLGGNMYGVHAVDASGAAISSYVLEDPAEVCVPLPASLRTNISRLSLAAINSDGSLTILAAQVRLDEAGGTMVCGNLSNLPASVAVGAAGAPDAIPTATPVPEPELPPTGGTSPASGSLVWVLLLGIAVLTLGSALATIRRRDSVRSR